MKPKLHVILWKRQKGLCWLCHEPMLEWPRDHPLAWSYDHVQPLAACGANRPRNKLLAHRDCNQARGHEAIPHGVKLTAFISRAISRVNLAHQRRYVGLKTDEQANR